VWLLAVLTNVSAVQRLTVLCGLARGKTVGAPGEMPGPRDQGLRDRQLSTLRAVLEQPDVPEEGRRDEN
jgi:hypothetical protein